MALEQFTYTGSPWGATAPGWTVFQHSPGITPKAAAELKVYYQFKEFGSGASDTGKVCDQALPVKFAFVKNQNTKGRIVCQSLDSGLRWYDQTRGRDYFAHVFVESSPNEAFGNVNKTFNPMAWFLSPSFQTEFPKDKRAEALEILQGKRPNVPPPLLESFSSSADIRQNEELKDDALLLRLSSKGKAIEKIGRIIEALVSRFPEKRETTAAKQEPLFFDATKEVGIDAMAMAVRLLPLSMREEISFCTWLPSSENRSFPASDSLHFVGTFRSGEAADPDTGVYGELPKSQLEFKSIDDVELFKRLIDAGGLNLDKANFNALVACWKVATGRTVDLESLRGAFVFASRLQDMSDVIKKEIVATFSEKEAPLEYHLVAWFELHIPAFEAPAKRICAACVSDFEVLKQMLNALKGDDVYAAFLDNVASEAKVSGVAAFVNRIIGFGVPSESFIRTLPQDHLIRLACDYCNVWRKYGTGTVREEMMNEDTRLPRQIVGKLKQMAGSGVKDIANVENGIMEVEKRQEYNKAISGLSVDSVELFLKKNTPNNLRGVDIRKDVLNKLKPEIKDIKGAVTVGVALEKFGLGGREIILEKFWESEKKTYRLKKTGDGQLRFRTVDRYCRLNLLLPGGKMTV